MRATKGWRTTSAGEARYRNAFDALEHAFGIDQAADRTFGQVDLAHVARYHCLGAEA
jgi:hypothetical protein